MKTELLFRYFRGLCYFSRQGFGVSLLHFFIISCHQNVISPVIGMLCDYNPASASLPCFSKLRDELLQMKPLSRTNCSQLFSASSCSAPSSPSHLVGTPTRPGGACPGSALIPSPAHNCQVGGFKQATGVGGTTYEISV